MLKIPSRLLNQQSAAFVAFVRRQEALNFNLAISYLNAFPALANDCHLVS